MTERPPYELVATFKAEFVGKCKLCGGFIKRRSLAGKAQRADNPFLDKVTVCGSCAKGLPQAET